MTMKREEKIQRYVCVCVRERARERERAKRDNVRLRK